MVIIERDMMWGTEKEVTFRKAWISLLNTCKLSRIALNYLLLSNCIVMNDRMLYKRKLPPGIADSDRKIFHKDD